MIATRTLLMFTMFSLARLCTLGGQLQAYDQAAESLHRAQAFLGTKEIGAFVIHLAHPGAEYSRHAFQEVRPVKNQSGEEVPSKFTAVYKFVWYAEDCGNTTLGFICNNYGIVEDVIVIESDVIEPQPFRGDDLTIQRVGFEQFSSLKEGMSDNDLEISTKLLNEGDSRRLLGFCLKLRQALGL